MATLHFIVCKACAETVPTVEDCCLARDTYCHLPTAALAPLAAAALGLATLAACVEKQGLPLRLLVRCAPEHARPRPAPAGRHGPRAS